VDIVFFQRKVILTMDSRRHLPVSTGMEYTIKIVDSGSRVNSRARSALPRSSFRPALSKGVSEGPEGLTLTKIIY